MKRTIVAAAAAALLLVPVETSAKIVSKFGITIENCTVNKGDTGLISGINIVYVNTNQAPVAAVSFLVKYQGNKAVFRDTGTFTNGAQINHNLTNAMVGDPWNGPTPKLCTVQRAVSADGTVLK
jgi:hypothetical protein